MPDSLPVIAHKLRQDIARMFYVSHSGHFAPALSCVDVFAVLYFGGLSIGRIVLTSCATA